MFEVPNEYRVRTGLNGSDRSYGNNGIFVIKKGELRFHIIASDGLGWEHVSVTINKNRTPTWEEMCWVKDQFWGESDTVVQYHPAKKDHVNNHEYCLHLWRNEYGFPTPLNIMV